MGFDVNKVIQIALDEVGYHEKASNKDLDSKTANSGSKNYTKYARDLGGGCQGYAWCNCFVNWCFWKAYGTSDAKKLLCTSGSWSYYTPTSSNYFDKKGQFFKRKGNTPMAGDVIYFKWTGSNRICHVGIVEYYSGSTIHTIEGNSSQQVRKRTYSISNTQVYGWGRPNYGTSPQAENVPSGLKRGDKGDAVVELQSMLMSLGYDMGSYGADGDFGATTETQLKKFQSDNGLTQNGIYDDATKTKLLEVYTNSKKEQDEEIAKPDPIVRPSDDPQVATDFIMLVQATLGIPITGVYNRETISKCLKLKKGNKGTLVKAVQMRLNEMGYNISINSIFDSTLENLIKQFQSDKELSVNGKVDFPTWDKLFLGKVTEVQV